MKLKISGVPQLVIRSVVLQRTKNWTDICSFTLHQGICHTWSLVVVLPSKNNFGPHCAYWPPFKSTRCNIRCLRWKVWNRDVYEDVDGLESHLFYENNNAIVARTPFTIWLFLHCYVSVWLVYVNWVYPTLSVDSLWPSDAIWRYISVSTFAQIMCCSLTAPSYCLNKCQLIR